jgi:hypothetical protein
MGEREHVEDRQDSLKTVNEFRDQDDPDKVLVSHKSDTGEEPVYVKEETLMSEDHIEKGQVHAEQASDGKLEVLVKDYYMFSLAPVYLTCLLDRSINQIKMDLIYQYSKEMNLAALPKVIYYNSDPPLFYGGDGFWGSLLQGLEKTDNNISYLFPQWAKQLVFVDRNVRPMQYWRVNVETITVRCPSISATPVDIDVYLPTGSDKRLGVRARRDGLYEYVQLQPEDWVLEESMRYFAGVDA